MALRDKIFLVVAALVIAIPFLIFTQPKASKVVEKRGQVLCLDIFSQKPVIILFEKLPTIEYNWIKIESKDGKSYITNLPCVVTYEGGN